MAQEAQPMHVSATSLQKAYPLWFTSFLDNASVWVGQATTHNAHPLHRFVSMTRAPVILVISEYFMCLTASKGYFDYLLNGELQTAIFALAYVLYWLYMSLL